MSERNRNCANCERLKVERDTARTEAERVNDRNASLRDQLENNRSLLDSARAECVQWQGDYERELHARVAAEFELAAAVARAEKAEAERTELYYRIGELSAENQRLREALEEIVGQSAAWATKIARAALAAPVEVPDE